eukprot:TRINITY_DN1305_c0_g1_i4.p1 TRINITY_DN1305_c0_g1~~TRINITY_DN1305_c0_g1_i4.p1  ORF type:complete len:261 (+),score=56.04 TRINITY_DN1305_c0_g1_i4:324-1106(+)
MEETLSTLSDKQDEFRSTANLKATTTWDAFNQEVYQQRATNPKIAHHPKPLVTGGRIDVFSTVQPNEGEYMSGAKLAMLTVPSRSLYHLRHPTWYAGRAVCEKFPKPRLDLMGPKHPVKEQIQKHVAKLEKAVNKHGPVVGAKGAKGRLEWKEKEELKARAGRGEMPPWIRCCCANRQLNPSQLSSGNYLLERQREKAVRPARCDPRKGHIKTLGKPGYFEDDLRLINTDVRGAQKLGWPEGDTKDYMSLAEKKPPAARY